MLDGYSGYPQQTLGFFHQSPATVVNLQDALEDHLFFGLHHAIQINLLFETTKITFGDICLLQSSEEPFQEPFFLKITFLGTLYVCFPSRLFLTDFLREPLHFGHEFKSELSFQQRMQSFSQAWILMQTIPMDFTNFLAS